MTLGYKKQIATASLLLLAIVGVITYFGAKEELVDGNCLQVYKSLVRCVDVVLFGKFEALALMTFALLLSLIPLFFLKEGVYRVWRKFVLIALPVIVFLIAITPESSGELISIEREGVAMFTSALFLILSYIVIFVSYLKTRGK